MTRDIDGVESPRGYQVVEFLIVEIQEASYGVVRHASVQPRDEGVRGHGG